MADTIELNAGSGGAILATDDILGVHYQRVKVTWGADGTATDTSAANPLPVVQTGTHTVTGAGGTFPITDSGGSLTIDNAALSVVGGGVEATALRVTIATDSTGVLSIDDNGASITVDGTVAISGSVAITNAALGVTGGGVEATALRVTLASDSTGLVSVDDNGGSLTVDGTLAVTQSGAWSLSANQSVNVAQINGVTPLMGNGVTGTGSQRVTIASDNTAFTVNIGTMPNVTLAAGTNTNEVVGDAAHDAAIAGNPVRIGARALSADFTAVATGDTTDVIASLLGKQIVLPYALPGSSWNYAAASGGIVNTTGVSAKAAAGAGIRNYVTHVDVVNGHATVSTDVQIRDGASGTVLWRGFAQAAGGGVSAEFNPPLRGTANTLIEIACGTTGTATYFNLVGFVAAE